MKTTELASRIKAAGIELYKDRSGFAPSAAQRNLQGKSNYANDNQLKQQEGKILACHALDDGLVLGLIESFKASNEANAPTLYRSVFFDVFGNVVAKTPTEDAAKSPKAAQGMFWQHSDELKADELTIEGIDQRQKVLQAELDDLKKLAKELK